MFDGMTAQKLKDILAAVEPVELKGVALLKRRRPRPGQWYPADVNPRTMAAAATELMEYASKCNGMRHDVERLLPIPSPLPVEEWPL